MSALEKVLRAAGVPPAVSPAAARSEAAGLISLAASIGTEAGFSAEDLAFMTWELAADPDAAADAKGGDDGDEDDDATKDPLYKKLIAKGMPPKAAAAMVKRKNAAAADKK